MKKSVLFVCLGNICRSPAAEGVFRHLAHKAGLADRVHVDSAGTGDWHVGEPPDARMIHHALKRGYDLRDLEARQFLAPSDFHGFDYILTMDEANLKHVRALDRTGQFHQKVQPLVAFCRIHDVKEVPDPYYKDENGFEHVLDLIEDACQELLEEIRGSK